LKKEEHLTRKKKRRGKTTGIDSLRESEHKKKKGVGSFLDLQVESTIKRIERPQQCRKKIERPAKRGEEPMRNAKTLKTVRSKEERIQAKIGGLKR